MVGIGSVNMDVAAREIRGANQGDIAFIADGTVCYIEAVAARHHIAVNGAVAIGGADNVEVGAAIFGEAVLADHSERVCVRRVDHLAVAVRGHTVNGTIVNSRIGTLCDFLLRGGRHD